MKTIYGGQPKNPPAFCKYHHGYVTPTEMGRHQCLAKQCSHLVRYEEHPYWEQRRQKKEQRKQRKARINAYFAS